MDNVEVFILTDHRPRRIQDSRTDQHFIGFGFPVISIFRAFTVLIGSVLCVFHLLLSLVLELVQFLKLSIYYLGLHPCKQDSVVSPTSHNKFMQVAFSSSFLSMNYLVFPILKDSPSQSYIQKAGAIFTSLCHILSCIQSRVMVGWRETQSYKGLPQPLGNTVLLIKEEVSPLSQFRHHCTHTITTVALFPSH